MIRHIVSWRLKAENPDQRRSDAEQIKARLEGLQRVIPEIARVHVGIDIGETTGNWDVVLDSDFASRDDLEAYQVHPEHRIVADFIGSVRAERSCVDYEV